MDSVQASQEREISDRTRKIRMWPSGRCVNPLDMNPDDIDIVDIAHHLSNECRWAGACPHHYSVAQHSVLVSECFDAPDMKLAGLLHDAAEAYLKDLPSPIKHDPRMAFYCEADRALTAMIFERFGLDPALLAHVKGADDLLCWRERDSWWREEPFPGRIIPRRPAIIKKVFLRHFDACMQQLNL